MGEFDTDNDMMKEQQSRDTHGASDDPANPRHDIDPGSEADRRAAQKAGFRRAGDDDVLADNRAGLGPGDSQQVQKTGTWPPLASRGRSLLGN